MTELVNRNFIFLLQHLISSVSKALLSAYCVSDIHCAEVCNMRNSGFLTQVRWTLEVKYQNPTAESGRSLKRPRVLQWFAAGGPSFASVG